MMIPTPTPALVAALRALQDERWSFSGLARRKMRERVLLSSVVAALSFVLRAAVRRVLLGRVGV